MTAVSARHPAGWSVFDLDIVSALARTGDPTSGDHYGYLDTTTNFIEHPELVAQRLQRFVDIVGSDRVIAGSDCGFGTFAGFGAMDGDIVYAKLAAMAQGARNVASHARALTGG